MFYFLVASLANWRLCKMISSDEDGPGDVLHKIRYWMGVRYNEYGDAYGENWWAKATTCIRCLSVWMAMLFAIPYAIDYGWYYIVYVLALSGSTILIDSVIE